MKIIRNLSIVIVAVVAFAFTLKVNAMSESELYSKITKSYTINGQTYKIDNSYAVEIKRYLDTYDVTDDEANYIATQIDEAVKVVASSGVTDIKNLSNENKDKLKSLVSNVKNNTSVNATVDKDGNLVIYDKDGNVFSKITKDMVRKTGNGYLTVIVSSISIIGLLVIAMKSKKLNA